MISDGGPQLIWGQFTAPSDPDEEVEAEGGGDVQRLQAEGGRRVGEQDGEHVLCVHQELRGVVSLLRTGLDTQVNNQVTQWGVTGKDHLLLRQSPAVKSYFK